MITPIDALPWTAADLTGNSAIVPFGGALYVVGNRRGDNTLAIYQSTNHGFSWTILATIPAPIGTMDPAIAIDINGLLRIVVAHPNALDATRFDVSLYTYDTQTNTLGSLPVTLVTSSKTMSAYDVLVLSNSNTLVVASSLEALGHDGMYVLQAFVVAPTGAYTSSILESSPWSSGDTCGAVTLIQSPGGDVELYYTKHHRAFIFRPVRVDILHCAWNAVAGWSPATSITNYTAMFSDDKLTVIPLADGRRVLSQAYHNQVKATGRQTTILYGVGSLDTMTQVWSWIWRTINPSADYEVKEPVVETDGTNVYVAYLQCPRIDGTTHSTNSGTMVVATLDPDTLLAVPSTGAWQQFQFRWLRGTKTQVEPSSKWMVLGFSEAETTNAVLGGVIFFSLYNLAPHAVISPATLTLQRGVAATLDATGTTDPDLDSLTYTWAHNYPNVDDIALVPILGGKKAFLTVAKTIGPLATGFNVTVTVNDGFPGHQSSATCAVTVPFNHEPVIVLPATLAVLRNSKISVQATVTDTEDADIKFSWRQISGTPIQLDGTDTSKVTAWVYRLHPDGEDIVLQLLVDDGVNRPVFKNIALQVPPIDASMTDSGILTRRFFEISGQPATISQRNAVGDWADVVESELRSDLYRVSVFSNSNGENRFAYLSLMSMQVVSQGSLNVFYRSFNPPVGMGFILDGVMDEQDYGYVLTDAGYIMRYVSPGPDGCSDWPDNVINLKDVSPKTFTHLAVLAKSGLRRLLAVWGPDGILLLSVDEGIFVVMDYLLVDQDSGMLPVNFVQFIRLEEVDTLKSGKLFVGTRDDVQGTQEVLIDLAYRRVIGQWDRQTLIGRTANTGEILAQVTDDVMAEPDAPTWNAPAQVAGAPGLYLLSWQQVRPDLTVGYEVWLGRDAAIPSLYVAIPAGSIRSTKLLTKPGHIYHLTVRAIGRSAMSAFSMESTLTT